MNGYTNHRAIPFLGSLMHSLNAFYGHYAIALWILTVVAVVLLASWIARLQRRQRQTQSQLDKIFGDVSEGNTAQKLAEYLGTVRSTSVAVGRMREEHDRVVAQMPSVIRHVGLVRFSPFRDTGGDQSFTLALLDGRGDGVVVTALHSRHDSRLYAKPIESGSSPYSLTPEEREAMERALNGSQATIPSS
jgi:Protein of unknown function (DUF4446)